jgi:hypothetical protein
MHTQNTQKCPIDNNLDGSLEASDTHIVSNINAVAPYLSKSQLSNTRIQMINE